MNKRSKLFVLLFVIAIMNQWIASPIRGNSLFLGNQQAISCTVNVLQLNMRSGPGTQFTISKKMRKGDMFNAIERSSDSAWVFGESSNTIGWTSARFVTCASSVAQLPISTQSSVPNSESASTSPSDSASTSATTTAPVNSSGTSLIQPTGNTLSGRVKFEWKTGNVLKKNQGYVVLFWREGQDPLKEGFALTEAKTTTLVDLDLDKMSNLLPKLLQYDSEYYWGVALVQIHPKRNLQLLQSSAKFIFVAPDSGNAVPLPAIPKPPK